MSKETEEQDTETSEVTEETETTSTQGINEETNEDTKQGEEEEQEEETRTKDTKEEFTDEQKYLLKAILNPQTSKETILQIAQRLGLEVTEKRQSKQDTQKGLLDELTESLGEDWAWLAPKLGPVFERRLKALESNMENRFGKFETESTQDKFERAEKLFFKENPEAKKVFPKMRDLATRYTPPQGIDPMEYYEDLYRLAATKGKSLAQTVKDQKNQRITRNRDTQDVQGRPGSSRTVETPTQPKSISEAAQLAAKQLAGKKF